MNSYPNYIALKEATTKSSCYLERISSVHNTESGGFFTWIPGVTDDEIPGLVIAPSSGTGRWFRVFDTLKPEHCGALGVDAGTKPSPADGAAIYGSLYEDSSWDTLAFNVLFRAAEHNSRFRYVISRGKYLFSRGLNIPRAQTTTFGITTNANYDAISGVGGSRSLKFKLVGGSYGYHTGATTSAFIFDNPVLGAKNSGETDAVYNENAYVFEDCAFGRGAVQSGGGLRLQVGKRSRVVGSSFYNMLQGLHLHFNLNPVVSQGEYVSVRGTNLYVGTNATPVSGSIVSPSYLWGGFLDEPDMQCNGYTGYNNRVQFNGSGNDIGMYYRSLSDYKSESNTVEGDGNANIGILHYNNTTVVNDGKIERTHLEASDLNIAGIMIVDRQQGSYVIDNFWTQYSPCPILYIAKRQGATGGYKLMIRNVGFLPGGTKFAFESGIEVGQHGAVEMNQEMCHSSVNISSAAMWDTTVGTNFGGALYQPTNINLNN